MQPVGQLAVVHQQQQPLAVAVEASDVEQTLPGADLRADTLADQVTDVRSAAVVGHRGQHAARLVQREVDDLVAVVTQLDPPAVDADLGGGSGRRGCRAR